MLTPPSSSAARARRRSPGALKQLEHRARGQDGVWRCVYVPVRHEVIEVLIERGLPAEETTDPKAVGRELAEVLLQWVERWRREKNNS
jgi:hypothetical protein